MQSHVPNETGSLEKSFDNKKLGPLVMLPATRNKWLPEHNQWKFGGWKAIPKSCLQKWSKVQFASIYSVRVKEDSKKKKKKMALKFGTKLNFSTL
jgi:hypothetical protein